MVAGLAAIRIMHPHSSCTLQLFGTGTRYGMEMMHTEGEKKSVEIQYGTVNYANVEAGLAPGMGSEGAAFIYTTTIQAL